MGETETMKQQERYYNQRQIADILGVSKATASRYLNKLNISAKEENGAKLYPETVLKQLKNRIKTNKKSNNSNSTPSTTQLLQEQVDQLKKEVELLKEQLKIKDKQIETANHLADQAQQLNALDKDKKELPIIEAKEKPRKKHWWQK